MYFALYVTRINQNGQWNDKGETNMSVKEIVRKKEKERTKQVADQLEKQEKERKQKEAQYFKDSITGVIAAFESTWFNINSTDEEVADKILHWGEGHTICILRRTGEWICDKNGNRYKYDGNYTEITNYMPYVKFQKDDPDDHGKKLITKSRNFNSWKKALEDKFGVKITIQRMYGIEERFEAPSSYYFTGIGAYIYIK